MDPAAKKDDSWLVLAGVVAIVGLAMWYGPKTGSYYDDGYDSYDDDIIAKKLNKRANPRRGRRRVAQRIR